MLALDASQGLHSRRQLLRGVGQHGLGIDVACNRSVIRRRRCGRLLRDARGAVQHEPLPGDQLFERDRPAAEQIEHPLRAAHFTGRKEEQCWLLEQLKPGHIVTICGLGGMGKTALVAEVLWKLSPGDTPPVSFPDGVIFHNFYRQSEAAIALEQISRIFGEDPRPTPALAAQRALSGRHTLLVFDGAEEADSLRQVLEVCAGQTILITSRKRTDAHNPDYLLDLKPLPDTVALEVLQAWGQKQASQSSILQQICQLVGNLPLALRIIGHYLTLYHREANEYLLWLQESPLEALDQGTSQQASIPILLGHSIAKLSADAQQALTVVGLLSPAAFDCTIIMQVLNLSITRTNKAMDELESHGLLIRSKELYEVSHALIHTYLREKMLVAQGRQREFARRIVLFLRNQFVEITEGSHLAHEAFLPHVQSCLRWINQYDLATPDADAIFLEAGAYLVKQMRYEEAEPLYLQALAIREQLLGLEHLYTASCLGKLAELYEIQGKYAKAEPLLQQTLAIREKLLGPEHSATGTALNNLGIVYWEQGKYKEAEPLLQRALTISERTPGDRHPDTAMILNNLAMLYYDQGKYEGAGQLLQHALEIEEDILGPERLSKAVKLSNLAILYGTQGSYEQATHLSEQALTIYQQMLGPEHPDTGAGLNNLGFLYRSQGKYAEAEPLFLQALEICKRVLGLEHPHTARCLSNLGLLYEQQGKYAEAESLLQQVLQICEQVLKPEHPDMIHSLNNLGFLYEKQGKHAEAEPLLLQALEIRKRVLPGHPDMAHSLNNLASVYKSQGKYAEAEPLFLQALEIYEQVLGPEHPDIVHCLSNLAIIYKNQEKYAEAELLVEQVLAIRERALGPNHLTTAKWLEALASLYSIQKKYEQAESVYQRVLNIREQVLGPEHTDTFGCFCSLGAVYESQGKYAEAELLCQRMLTICERALGPEHPVIQTIQEQATWLAEQRAHQNSNL